MVWCGITCRIRPFASPPGPLSNGSWRGGGIWTESYHSLSKISPSPANAGEGAGGRGTIRFRMRIQLISILLWLAGLSGLHAQDGFGKLFAEKEGWKIEPYLMLQVWATYSHGQEVYDEGSEGYLPVDPRYNLMLRRGRVGFRLEPYEGLKFNIALAYDLLGHDVHTALLGGNNNGTRPIVSVWDAFLQWKLKPGSEKLNLVAGYFRPQLSRESITSGWSVPSFEKAMSQSYIRIHLTGIGPGRAPGLNLGGLLPGHDGVSRINYNVGIFTPVNQIPLANTSGVKVTPLLVGRVVYYLGDPEMSKYGIGYQINRFGERNGLSLGAGGSWQGANDLFRKSTSASLDVLFNRGPFHLDGEMNWMWREGPSGQNGNGSAGYSARTGHLRAGYNLRAGSKFFLEPVAMAYCFRGAESAEAIAEAKDVLGFSGRHLTYDIGVNWYLNRNRLRLMLHYTISEGDYGEAEPGFSGNLHYLQSGIGAIRRGNWLGLGLNAIF